MDIKGAFRDLQQKKQAAEKEAKEARAPLFERMSSTNFGMAPALPESATLEGRGARPGSHREMHWQV